MPIRIPDFTPPLVAVSACANRISLSAHLGDSAVVPDKKTQESAPIAGGYISLIREQLSSGDVHFHLDVVKAASGESLPGAETSLEDIQKKFEPLIGKVLHINFQSRFLVPAKELSPLSIIGVFNSGGVRIGNITALLPAAQLRLNDSIFSQLTWQQVARADGSPPTL